VYICVEIVVKLKLPTDSVNLRQTDYSANFNSPQNICRRPTTV